MTKSNNKTSPVMVVRMLVTVKSNHFLQNIEIK